MAAESMKLLYDQDFYEWTQRSAELLRRGCYAELDIEHVAEELEDMGKSEKSGLASRVRQILIHKLKLLVTAGPLRERNRAGWTTSIHNQQGEIEIRLISSPSLRRELKDLIPRIYRLAVRAIEQDVPDRASDPPASCPWTIDEILGSFEE